MTTNTSSTAGNQYNLLIPVVFVRDIIAQGARIKILRCPARKTQVEEDPQTTESGLVQDGQIMSLLCVAREKDKDQGKGWVQSGSLNETSHWVSSETLWEACQHIPSIVRIASQLQPRPQ